MKPILTFLIALITYTSVAQQGINYKAVIKDDLGNVVASQNITVQFSILQGIAETNEYTEAHTPTTDANGVIILSIGEGTLISGNYATIDWGSNSHFLNVKCDIGNGLVDLGTTGFQKIPYAKHADIATTANNVSGLEYYTDFYSGWRLIGLNPDSYGDIGLKAVDLSIGSGSESIYGALGDFSFATGTQTTASGIRATAMGYNTLASGEWSTALGNSTIASGENSTAMGVSTNAEGKWSIAFGSATQTKSYGETALGLKNTDYSPNQPSAWWGTDRLLVVGNGNTTTSDALIILKNGTITAPSLDLPEIVNNKALITKEYADINLGSTGLEALDEGNGIGWRIKGRDPDDFGSIGFHAIDLSFSDGVGTTYGATGFGSTALGRNTRASDSYATVMGSGSEASGIVSTAMGFGTTASGTSSTAMGSGTTASGYASTAMGDITEASGSTSIAMGESTIASGDYATAMGRSTEASEDYSTAMGNNSRAFGDASIAMGQNTLASGVASTAKGFETIASGNYSTAMGFQTTASGNVSTTMGSNTTASGFSSTAMGRYTTASSYVETSICSYNTDYTPNNTMAWSSTDRLFVVGNGSSSSNKSNALTIYKNGNIAVGNITPSSSTTENVLDVSGRVTLRPKTGSGSTSGIWYTDVGGIRRQFAGAKTHSLVAANREWGIYISGAYRFWVNGDGDATLTGSLSQNSDRRLKINITDLSYGLDEVLQLKPKEYFWKDKPNQEQVSLGLIAQDVQDVIANIVHEGDDEEKTLSLSYIELVPVLIQAIKEQQEIIESQKLSINKEKDINKKQTNKLQALLKRVEAIENSQSN